MPSAEKDDLGVILSPQRMTESITKDDKNDGKDDRIDRAYKEEPLPELIPEPESATTTARTPDEFPADFARLMDQEVALDDGALRRLWQQARAIVPDATAGEVGHFFHQRALIVYRNRKLDNPTGLMLSTVSDWFPRRRVLERRQGNQTMEREAVNLQLQVDEALAELRLPIAGRDRAAR